MKQFVLMLLLLFALLGFHNAVIIGTQNGLLLWYQTLVPSLLPFILVTNALSETNTYQVIALRFKNKYSNRIYEIMAIILGNLCGYPLGGKIINDFVKNNCMSSLQANRILPLASQASPMFLIGYVYIHTLHDKIPLSIYLISIYLPVIIYYIIQCLYTDKHSAYTSNPVTPKKIYMKDTFLHAVEIMVMIGIYVMIFSILFTILLPIFHTTISKILLSSLEITTGINLLTTLKLSETFRLTTICTLSAFGGICSAYQVKGVLEYPDTNIKKYLLDKCILSAGTFGIIYLYCKMN